jgi:quercetin dioxygenase-like cupin family protein
MKRTLLVLAAGIGVGVGGMNASHHRDGGENVKVLSATDIREKLDGKETKATAVKVTLAPGEVEPMHRHPGPGFGYVVEGEYELGIDDQPTKVVKAGETFYEPTGSLHRVGKNPGKVKTRIVAWVVHPRDAKDIVIPEPKK